MADSDKIINNYCKLYTLFLVSFQVYFYHYNLPVAFPPLIPIFVLGALAIILSKKKSFFSNAGYFICLISMALQIPFLLIAFIVVFLSENLLAGNKSLSLYLLLNLYAIILLSIGVFLYIRYFLIPSTGYKAKPEKIVFIILFITLVTGFFHINGGPHIGKSSISPDTSIYIKNQISELYSWNPIKRCNAMEQLSRFPSLSIPAIPFLISMLDDDIPLSSPGDSGAQHTPGEVAATTLRKIGKPALEYISAALKNEKPLIRLNAVSSLDTNMGPRAHIELLSCINDENKAVRERAFYKMETFFDRTQDPRFISAFITGLKDPEIDVKQAALRSMSENDPRVIEPLISLVTDGEKEIQKAVKNKLSYITSQDFGTDQSKWQDWWSKNKKLFIELRFEQENNDLYDVISYSLRDLKDPFDISLLTEALKSENINRRKSAIWMLGKTDSPEAVEPLITALHEDNKSVKRLVAQNLFQITAQNYGTDFSDWENWWRWNKDAFLLDKNKYIRENTGFLNFALRSNHHGEQEKAFKLAIKLGEPAFVPLIEALNNGDDEIRKKAASTLSDIKDLRAIDVLIQSLDDRNADVRRTASSSLAALTGQHFGEDPEDWKKWWEKNRSLF